MEQKNRALSNAALFAAATIWGISFFVVKNTVEVFPPMLLLAIRFSTACVLLCVLFHKRLRQLNKRYWLRGGLIGLTLFAGYSLQTVGITGTTPGKNAFLTAIYCVLVPFLYWMVDHVKPDGYNFTAAVLCISGIGLVSLTGGFSISPGDGLTLLGGVAFAFQVLTVSKFSKELDPVLLTIIQFAVTGGLTLVCSLMFEQPPTQVSTGALQGLVFLILFPTTLAILLQNVGQSGTSPSSAAIILSLESVFGVLFSMLFYHEQLTLRLAVGFALIFLAVIISETKLSFLKRGQSSLTATEHE